MYKKLGEIKDDTISISYFKDINIKSAKDFSTYSESVSDELNVLS